MAGRLRHWGPWHGLAMAKMVDDVVQNGLAAHAPVDPVQDELWDVIETGNPEVPSPFVRAMIAPPKRGRGRPKNSVNKRTLATAEWLLSQNRHPLAVMFDIVSLSVDDLAKAIGLKDDEITPTLRLQLFDRQTSIREFVTRYVASPMPAQQADGGAGGVNVMIDMGGQVAPKGVSVHSHGGQGGAAGAEIDGIFARLSDAAQVGN